MKRIRDEKAQVTGDSWFAYFFRHRPLIHRKSSPFILYSYFYSLFLFFSLLQFFLKSAILNA